MQYFEAVFDCETKKFFDEIQGFDPAKLGVSIVSVYSRNLDENFNEIAGKMDSFWEKDFGDMFKIFDRADRIIGFNSIGFDVPALSPYLPSYWPKLKHFDILAEVKKVIGKRVSLDSIAKATLQSTKNDSGENAVKYWNLATPEALEKLRIYCEMDVEITTKIYDFVRKNKYLKYKDYWNEIHDVKLDFGYQLLDNEVSQTSLF